MEFQNICNEMVAPPCTLLVGWLSGRTSISENFTQQTQAPANRNARSKQWQPWLTACRLRFLRFSVTQRKRLRLNGNRADFFVLPGTITLIYDLWFNAVAQFSGCLIGCVHRVLAFSWLWNFENVPTFRMQAFSPLQATDPWVYLLNSNLLEMAARKLNIKIRWVRLPLGIRKNIARSIDNIKSYSSSKRMRSPAITTHAVDNRGSMAFNRVCLFVRSITQKRMIPKCLNLVS